VSPRIEKGLAVPLYRQIYDLIRHRIGSGEYPQGGQIPSENELCRELKISRVTLREGLRQLARDHMVVKVPGKGTFVGLEPASRLAPVKYAGFLEDLQERVRNLAVVEVEATRIAPSEELRARLRLAPEETTVVVFKRLRHIDREPFSYTLNYLPTAIGDRINVDRLHREPLLQILRKDLRIPIVRANETIAAAPASAEVARKLGIAALFPVMHVQRLMFTTKDRPLELVETFYRADKYHYSVSLVRTRQGRSWRWRTEVETSD
jgi:GntR family transcriptional regulator